jgi:hypothetical protein
MSEETKQAATSAPATGASGATTSVDATPTAAPATGQTEGLQPQKSSATLTGGMDEAMREEIRRAVKAEYEGKGGKMSKLQSENARLKKIESARQAQIVNQAKQAMQVNTPESNLYAAQTLAATVDEMERASKEANAAEERAAWYHTITTNLGLDPDDEQVQQEALQAWDRGPWDVQQAVARLAKQREAARAEEAEKRAKQAVTELETVKADVPRLVKAEFTKALAAGGFTDPESTTAGPPVMDEAWRKKSPQQLFRAGLEARRKTK